MTDDERAIRALVDRWFVATKVADLATVLSLMADDVVFMVPGKEPFGKAQFAAAFKGMEGMRIDGHSDITELQVLGDWAYVRNHIAMTITHGTDPAIRRAGYTLTLVRRQADGRWLLARDANLVTTQSS